MNNEEKKTKEVSGITLTSLVKVAFGRKILLIAITLLFTIACVLGVHFTINKSATYYTASFEYSYTDLNKGQYISGSKFDAREILLKENLEKVKASKEEYKNVDIESMVFNEHTIINQRKEYIELNNNQTIEKVYYEMSLPEKSFESTSQARSFFVDLVNLPIERNKEILEKLNLKYNLDSFNLANSYEAQVQSLINQYNLIVSEYQALAKTFNNYVFEDGSRLFDKLNNVMNRFANGNDLNILLNEINVNGYVKDNTVIEQKRTEQSILKQERELNEAKMNALMSQRDALIANSNNLQSLELNSYNMEIIKLTNRNKELDFEINMLEKQITSPADTTSFDRKLGAYKAQLEELTNELFNVKKEILMDNSLVFFESNKIISSNGGINIIIVGVLGLIVGLCGAMCINLIIDHKKLIHVTLIEDDEK